MKRRVMHLVPQTIYLEIKFIQNLKFAREFVSNVFCLFVCVCVCPHVIIRCLFCGLYVNLKHVLNNPFPCLEK